MEVWNRSFGCVQTHLIERSRTGKGEEVDGTQEIKKISSKEVK